MTTLFDPGIDLYSLYSFQSLTKEQAEYCIDRMRPYVDDKGREIPGAYDYKTFCEELFSSS